MSGISGPHIFPRQDYVAPVVSGDSTGDKFLNLLASPLQSQISAYSFYGGLAWSFGLSSLLFVLFCLLRPRTNAVYAPRAKHADEKHAPPKINKSLFGWIKPILGVKEPEMVSRVGLDAVLLLRFIKMIRNIFLVMSLIGLGLLIPLNVVGSPSNYSDYSTVNNIMKMTPQYIYPGSSRFWGYVVVAYLFTVIIFGFMWWEYRALLKLKRQYFESPDYRSGLHSRSLMLQQIPKDLRTDDGIVRIVGGVRPTSEYPRTAIARNAKELPSLIEDHEDAVKKLEKHLAKYLGDPNKLPVQRPVCKPSKKDKAHSRNHKVDAIDYWTGRIRELEMEIKEVRHTLDQRNPMPYGFASYTHIEDAHAVAYTAKNKKPDGTVIKLAPRPNDIIWKNIGMSNSERKNHTFWNGLWMVLLTVVYIIPNLITAVFLSDFSHIALVWQGFADQQAAHPVFYGVLQGITAPLIQALIYMVLPMIFRRLLSKAGDVTKTSRERHVASRLFSFFVFNNLIVFSIFSAVFKFVVTVVHAAKEQNLSVGDAIKQSQFFDNLVSGLCQVSPFWITWQMQHNLGATIDLLQLLPLLWNTFLRKYTKPTPRQVIELTAPQPFMYAEYYNNYLFSVAVALAFATLQPLILLFSAIFLAMEYWFKKYLLLYVLITRIESGGAFWRMVFNRMLFCTILGNLIITLVVAVKGFWSMLFAMIPLILITIGFKWYCAKTFDDKMRFYTTHTYSDLEGPAGNGKASKNQDRVAVKFGNPALYKKLMTPMVHAKSQHLLKQVYGGRLEPELEGAKGYSDMYMSTMSQENLGKPIGGGSGPFEFVPENQLDFQHWKRRSEFRDEFGGEGNLFGGSSSRPTTPGSMMTFEQARNRSESPDSSRGSSRPQTGDYGVMYPRGYHQAPGMRLRDESPSGQTGYDDVPDPRMGSVDITAAGHPAFRDPDRASLSQGNLLQHAASMGQIGGPSPGAPTPGEQYGDEHYGNAQYGADQFGGYGGYGGGYGSAAATPDEVTSYDYFRRGRRY